MSFSDNLDRMDADLVEHACDPALLRPLAGGADVEISAILERPAEIEVIQSAQFPRSKPMVRIPVLLVASLKKGDIVIQPPVGGLGYRLAEAPRRPDDGRWWLAAVEDLGPLA